MKNRMFAIIGCILVSAPLYADHSWGPYHWARTTYSFDLSVIDSTTGDWYLFVGVATSRWSDSTKLAMVYETGDTSKRTRRQCRAPAGQVRICNLAYGFNGWLGIAGIYIDSNGHIEKGYTKLNDSYFSSGYYNKENWKQSVTCQELGHNVGLDHQDEIFINDSLFSCMDYQDPPHEFPNGHDYDQLDDIYGHLPDEYDSYDTGTSGGEDGDDGDDGGCNAPPGKGCNKEGKGQADSGSPGDVGWGMSLGRRGQTEKFLRIEPDGSRIVTFVTWVIGN